MISPHPIDVVYLIEHRARELDVACAVKHYCESRFGMSVHVASLPCHLHQTLRTLQPRVVVLPYARFSDTDGLLRDVTRCWPGAVYLDVAVEQFLSTWNQEFKAPRTNFELRHLIHHATGHFYEDYLASYGVDRSRIMVNGNPFYALYTEPYRRYFPSRRELAERYGLRHNRRWTFFPENYQWALMPQGWVDGYLARGYGAERVREQQQFQQSSLGAALRWLARAAETLDHEIILRPRPAIPASLYVQAFQRVLGRVPERVHIIKGGTVREWTLASDVVVSSFSTTLLEAALAEKPAYILEPVTFPEWIEVEWNALIPHLRTEEEFLAACVEADAADSKAARDYVINTTMSRGDPIVGLASILHRLWEAQPDPTPVRLEHLQSQPETLRRPITWRRLALAPAWRIKHLIMRLTEKRTDPQATPPNPWEMDDFTDADVKERTKHWAAVLEDYFMELPHEHKENRPHCSATSR